MTNKKVYIPPTYYIQEIIGAITLLQLSGSRNGYDGDDEGGFFDTEVVNNEILYPLP